MSFSSSGVVPDATVHGCGADVPLVNKRTMLLALAIVLCGVWGYARFGGSTSSLPPAPSRHVVGLFATPITFKATPGFNLAHIHVRSGPSAGFRIRETLARGEPLSGVARTTDAGGAF